MVFAEAKELRLHEQLARVRRAEPPRSLFTPHRDGGNQGDPPGTRVAESLCSSRRPIRT